MSVALNEEEMQIRYTRPGGGGRVEMPCFTAPITAGENLERALRPGEKPLFMPSYRVYRFLSPRQLPDNEARGLINDGGAPIHHTEGFPDMFGIYWRFIEQVGGAIVEPGAPTLSDMNEWEEKLVWPDVNAWDWEGARKQAEAYAKGAPELFLTPSIMNGYFERLISMMDFEGAAMAMIDDEQEDALHAFFDRLADLYIEIIDKYIEYFPEIRGFNILDDWGHQRGPFFSLETAMNILVPPMKKVCDHIHARGLLYDMHCCGKVESLVPAMIAIGGDSWSGQPMNDHAALFHKYGKQILIGVDTPPIPEDMPEEEIAKIAKAYVDEFFTPEATALMGYYSPIKNPKFYEYAYRYSREKVLEWGWE